MSFLLENSLGKVYYHAKNSLEKVYCEYWRLICTDEK